MGHAGGGGLAPIQGSNVGLVIDWLKAIYERLGGQSTVGSKGLLAVTAYQGLIWKQLDPQANPGNANGTYPQILSHTMGILAALHAPAHTPSGADDTDETLAALSRILGHIRKHNVYAPGPQNPPIHHAPSDKDPSGAAIMYVLEDIFAAVVDLNAID